MKFPLETFTSIIERVWFWLEFRALNWDGASSQIQDNYIVKSKLSIGVPTSLQIDTNGDTIIQCCCLLEESFEISRNKEGEGYT